MRCSCRGCIRRRGGLRSGSGWSRAIAGYGDQTVLCIIGQVKGECVDIALDHITVRIINIRVAIGEGSNGMSMVWIVCIVYPSLAGKVTCGGVIGVRLIVQPVRPAGCTGAGEAVQLIIPKGLDLWPRLVVKDREC